MFIHCIDKNCVQKESDSLSMHAQTINHQLGRQLNYFFTLLVSCLRNRIPRVNFQLQHVHKRMGSINLNLQITASKLSLHRCFISCTI